MQLRSDFSRREVVRPEDYEWVASPAAGVERMMLDRIGDEVARATTIVRFAPDSQFDRHTHGGGEEFLVLDGVFSDEHRDYPAGTYVRNPIGTAHTPRIGPDGAVILVKLCQFDPDDTAQFHIDTTRADFEDWTVPGLKILALHSHLDETVVMTRWAPGARFGANRPDGGEEIFVVEGTLSDEHGSYPAGTWIRNPDGFEHHPFSEEGCLIYAKTGHLPRT